MNRHRLARLERELASAREHPTLPRTESGLRALCLERLPELTAEAFGLADPRSALDYLRGLSSQQMLALYGEAMETMTERSLRNPNAMLRWFQALPIQERISLLTSRVIDWDWVDRQAREFAAQEQQS
jgi:hypothetical protein